MMTLERLIEVLQERTGDLQEQVEFIVVTKEGRIIAAGVETQAKAIIRGLKLFERAP